MLLAHVLPAFISVLLFAATLGELRGPVRGDELRQAMVVLPLVGLVVQGLALFLVGRASPTAVWRVAALALAILAVVTAPVGLALGMMTCGLGTIVHGTAVVLCVLGAIKLLKRSVALGFRADGPDD